MDVTIINIYTTYNRPSKCMKPKWTKLKGEIDISTIIVGNISTHS